MTSMILARNIQIPKLAYWFKSKAKLESVAKRIIRFLSKPICKITVAQFSASLLKLHLIHKWTLVIDRTNWKYGKTHRNFLVLGVLLKDQLIPLMANNLGSQRKCGNSNAQDRIDMMGAFKKAFPSQKIKCVIGDREFIGKEWMKFLIENAISFVVRLKEDWVVINDKENYRTIPIKDYITPLMKGSEKLRLKILLGACNPQEVLITAFWGKNRNEELELIIVQHSEDIKDAAKEYKRRWKIETCFRNIKSGGFQIEQSHMLNEKRLDNLMGIVLMCVAWILSQDEKTIQEIIKSNGFRWLSRFRSGLDQLLQNLIKNIALPIPTT
jgi:hypothetical protein